MTGRYSTCWHFIASVVAAGLTLGQTATAQDSSALPDQNAAARVPSEILGYPLRQANENQSQVQYPTNLKLSQIELITTPSLPTPRPVPVPQLGRGDDPLPPCFLFQWESPNDAYRNLMFGDPLLERHGFSKHERLQPTISALKFFTQGTLYPAHLILRKNRRCDNPLGWTAPKL